MNLCHIFWGLILTCILPMWTNYILKKYENRAAFNRFLFEQELKPCRNKQIESQKFRTFQKTGGRNRLLAFGKKNS